MKERDEIDKQLDNIQNVIDRVHENVRLEAMWDPSIADPKIHLSEEDLDEFLKSFADTDKGKQIKEWITLGAYCEAKKHKDERNICENLAVGSIDFYGVSFEDSVLACRGSIREVYKDIMDNGVRKNGLLPRVTINGKEPPKLEK